MKRDADEARRGIFSFVYVLPVLGLGGLAEVWSAVIEGNIIQVVNEKVARVTHNFPV